MLPARSARRGNRANTLASVHGSALPLRLAANAARFSRTVRFGNIWRPSGTSAMPARAMRSGALASMRLPRNSMLPARAGVRPMMERTVVVLPMPLRPSSATTSPGRISRSMPNSTWLDP